MSIPLRGRQEIFRRLQEQQEARHIRQFEQRQMLGLEPEHPDTEHDFTPPSYIDLGRSMRGFTPEQLASIRHESEMFFRGSGVGFDSYDFQNLGTRRSAEIYASPRRNIRGLHTQSMWFDEYVGRANTPDTRESIANTVRESLNSWSERALLTRMMRDRPSLFVNRNRNVYSSNPCAEIMMPYQESFFLESTFFSVDTYIAGGRTWSWDAQGWVIKPHSCRRTKKIIFGPVKDYMKELMHIELDNFLGITRQERKARELIKRKAGNKSLATLLLSKKEE